MSFEKYLQGHADPTLARLIHLDLALYRLCPPPHASTFVTFTLNGIEIGESCSRIAYTRRRFFAVRLRATANSTPLEERMSRLRACITISSKFYLEVSPLSLSSLATICHTVTGHATRNRLLLCRVPVAASTSSPD